MTKNRIVRAICTGFVFVVAINVMPVIAAEDSDGCWSGRHSQGSCLEYRTYVKNNTTYIELTNVCNARLYMKWCVYDRCGADGLDAGQTKTKSEGLTGTKPPRALAVGSNRPSQDWVCANKFDAWRGFRDLPPSIPKPPEETKKVGDAKHCVNITRDNDNETVFTNICQHKIYVIYCGNLKYNKKKCGDGPNGAYYTHASGIDPYYAKNAYVKELRITKSSYLIRWGACFGGIGFVNNKNYSLPNYNLCNGINSCLVLLSNILRNSIESRLSLAAGGFS